MASDAQSLLNQLTAFGWRADSDRCLVISRQVMPELPEDLRQALTWCDSVTAADDLQSTARHPFALVFDQLQHMPKARAVHLLARLRDCHADRVLLADEQGALTAIELLALGYVRCELGSAELAMYRHDPEEFHARRDWNNASHWANPENFQRYRW